MTGNPANSAAGESTSRLTLLCYEVYDTGPEITKWNILLGFSTGTLVIGDLQHTVLYQKVETSHGVLEPKKTRLLCGSTVRACSRRWLPRTGTLLPLLTSMCSRPMFIDIMIKNVKDSMTLEVSLPKTSTNSKKHKVPWWAPPCRTALS